MRPQKLGEFFTKFMLSIETRPHIFHLEILRVGVIWKRDSNKSQNWYLILCWCVCLLCQEATAEGVTETLFLEWSWIRKSGKCSYPIRPISLIYGSLTNMPCLIWKWQYITVERRNLVSLKIHSPPIRVSLLRCHQEATEEHKYFCAVAKLGSHKSTHWIKYPPTSRVLWRRLGQKSLTSGSLTFPSRFFPRKS